MPTPSQKSPCGFVEALAQDPGSGLDIGAEIVAQRQEGRALGRMPVRGHIGSQIWLTCIGPISTVPLVFRLTAPSEPPSTSSRITRTAGGTR